ncbi:hypothetical protein D3C81_1855480 [compost metagenome]
MRQLVFADLPAVFLVLVARSHANGRLVRQQALDALGFIAQQLLLARVEQAAADGVAQAAAFEEGVDQHGNEVFAAEEIVTG